MNDTCVLYNALSFPVISHQIAGEPDYQDQVKRGGGGYPSQSTLTGQVFGWRLICTSKGFLVQSWQVSFSVHAAISSRKEECTKQALTSSAIKCILRLRYIFISRNTSTDTAQAHKHFGSTLYTQK